MLKNDILEAKDFIVSVLSKGQEVDLMSIAMNQNNLGVACWWDYHPIHYNYLFESSEDDSEEEFSENAYMSKKSDFNFAYSLFKKSIKNFERGVFYNSYQNEVPEYCIKSTKNIDDVLHVFDESVSKRDYS